MNKPAVVSFFYEVPVSLKDRQKLKIFLEALFKLEKKKLGLLRYVFCSDLRLLEINRQFLAHDYFTDIITFGLQEENNPVEGEIYISIDRVRDNARIMGISFQNELHRVILHGALHLCGYGDKTKKEEQQMRKKEDFYLDRYFETFHVK